MIDTDVPEVRDGPRRVLYHQTIHNAGEYVSLLPLLEHCSGVTHLIVAAVHLSEQTAPHNIHINNDPPGDVKYDQLWQEVKIMQDHNVAVMLMLGGAARGTYALLDGSDESFEAHYLPMRDLIARRSIDGVDLDVEEHMSLSGIIRLIDRLGLDFGHAFIISLAPIATALHGGRNLSGFDYLTLESHRGTSIDFYNTQFYCNHGSLLTTRGYEKIMRTGWKMEKIVLGILTNHRNGQGWLPTSVLKRTIENIIYLLQTRHSGPRADRLGGVMGWEYFNSLPGGVEHPYQWMCIMSRLMGQYAGTAHAGVQAQPGDVQYAGRSLPSTQKECRNCSIHA